MAFDHSENLLVKVEGIRALLHGMLTQIITQQAEIIKLLTPGEPEPTTIVKDESTGTCPSCDGLEVSMGSISDKPVYQCNSCQLIWTNP